MQPIRRYSPGMIDGTPGDTSIILSGLLLVPKSEVSYEDNMSAVVFFHETIISASKAPSNAFNYGSDGFRLPQVGHGDYAVYGAMWAAGTVHYYTPDLPFSFYVSCPMWAAGAAVLLRAHTKPLIVSVHVCVPM